MTGVTTTTDELRQLRVVLAAVLGTDDVDALPAVDPDWWRGWSALTDLGVSAFCVPEDRGGVGFQVAAAVATAEEMGAALHGSPFAGLTASAHVLARAGDPVADEVLVGVLSGARICAFGALDPGSATAWVVDGAPAAEALVLVDRSSGAHLLFTEATTWKVEEGDEPFDVSRSAGAVTVDAGAGRPLVVGDDAHDLFRLLLAADAIGCVRRMHARAVDYAGQRVAFGRPIGGFQAVQHRLADHAVRSRGMALLVAEAARLVEAGADDAARAVALASVSVTTNSVRILHDLVQLTGGIGFTWEYGLHLHERRAHQDARLVAGARAAVRALVDLEGWDR